MSNPKVLYVEDEIFLAKIVSETLQSRGYEVTLESDGSKVMPKFEVTKPDVCILDVMLPNKDGFSIADDIREKDPNVPIIFLTAPKKIKYLPTFHYFIPVVIQELQKFTFTIG